jgi:RNA polymerase subunit RPABC4/transcription elongation factor Spt4
MGKVHPSSTQQKKNPSKKKSLSNEDIDLCPMCRESLYLDADYTQRVGLIDDDDRFCGWMCPHCKALFDDDDKLTGIQGMDEMGEA